MKVSYTFNDVAKFVSKHVVNFWRIPLSFMLDEDTRFIASFWIEFSKSLELGY